MKWSYSLKYMQCFRLFYKAIHEHKRVRRPNKRTNLANKRSKEEKRKPNVTRTEKCIIVVLAWRVSHRNHVSLRLCIECAAFNTPCIVMNRSQWVWVWCRSDVMQLVHNTKFSAVLMYAATRTHAFHQYILCSLSPLDSVSFVLCILIGDDWRYYILYCWLIHEAFARFFNVSI